jgi:hypothetical protein
MLGRLQMDVEEAVEAFVSVFRSIFNDDNRKSVATFDGNSYSRIQAAALEDALLHALSTQAQDFQGKMLQEEAQRCKTYVNFSLHQTKSFHTNIAGSFVCAASVEINRLVRLRGYEIPGERAKSNPTTLEAARATLSSALLFEPTKIGVRQYAGGDLGANNPVDQVWNEARSLWSTEENLESLVKCYISIGAGKPGRSSVEGDLSKLLTKTMSDLAMETERTAQDFEKRFPKLLDPLNTRYFRFNVDSHLQDVGWEEFLQQALVEAATEDYLDETIQKNHVAQCSTLLLLKHSTSST